MSAESTTYESLEQMRKARDGMIFVRSSMGTSVIVDLQRKSSNNNNNIKHLELTIVYRQNYYKVNIVAV